MTWKSAAAACPDSRAATIPQAAARPRISTPDIILLSVRKKSLMRALVHSRSVCLRARIWPARPSEVDLVRPLQTQHPARLVRRGDLQRELLQDAADLGDLLGVALRLLATLKVDAVFQADPDVAAHD